MKSCGVVELHVFLTSLLDRGEWSDSHPDRLTHCIGGGERESEDLNALSFGTVRFELPIV
jgi:hypothetical protein